MKHTHEELIQLQELPLEDKARMTKMRIQQWYLAFESKVYVSFSGGKDSTVLLHIARSMYPDIPALFVDTRLEYPEIREFVKSVPGVTIVRPELGFKQVLEKYGYPVISKEVADIVENVYEALDEPFKSIYRAALIKAIEEGELLG